MYKVQCIKYNVYNKYNRSDLFFLPIYMKYNSKRALIVWINGILYHSTKNRYLRIYDIICNMMMCYYTYTKDERAIRTIIFIMIHFMINNYILKKKYISLNSSHLYHVLCIQMPLSLCLEEQF